MQLQVSERYLGDRGVEYFAYQNERADLGGRLDARKFQPDIGPDDRVLDFGCGGGWILKHLDCAERVGVEPNPAARDICKRNGIASVSGAEEISGSFDVVITHHCLEHVPAPVTALQLLRKVVKASGKLIVVVPIDDWRGEASLDEEDINHHLHTWTPRLLKNTLKEGGFDAVSVRVLTHAWPPFYWQLYEILPTPLFDVVCGAFAIVRRRRQLIAVAKPA
jgi:SAM-dependent methyltransferase